LPFEIQNDPIWQRIDSAAYLFLYKLFEPRDNSLTIILQEAVANTSKAGPTVLPGGLTLPGDSSPIEPTEECKVFRLHWKNYVSYCVTEEMHGSTGKYDEEKYSGRLIRIYSKSNFLDFVEKNTGAHFDTYQHYQIACQNHIIDIASTALPELTSLSRTEAGLDKQPDEHLLH
jgi:hypothetical protein